MHGRSVYGLFAAVIAVVAMACAIYVDTEYGPPNKEYCENPFIDRPDCLGRPARCGNEIGRKSCPGGPLTDSERRQLASVPIEQRPKWSPNWGVPSY